MSMFRNLMLNKATEDLTWIDDAVSAYGLDYDNLFRAYTNWDSLKYVFKKNSEGNYIFLKNSNNAYINTEYYPNSKSCIYCDAKFPNDSNNYMIGSGWLDNTRINVRANGTTMKYDIALGNWASTTSSSLITYDDYFHVWKFDIANGVGYIDDKKMVTSTTYTNSENMPFGLFARMHKSSYNYYNGIHHSKFYAYEDGVLKIFLVPFYDGEYCFIDLVSNTKFYNANTTGAFEIAYV